jgi:hypothetical protein
VTRPVAAQPAIVGQPETGALLPAGREALGLLCRLCGLDEVPWPRTAYCSERCRRRAAYLARKDRLGGRASRPDVGRMPRRTTR